MFKELIDDTYYVRVYENRFVFRRIGEADAVLASDKPFSNKRLQIANLPSLANALRAAIKDKRAWWMILNPKIVIHPMVRPDGGFSEAERHSLMELAIDAGARMAYVITESIPEMSDEMLRELSSRTGRFAATS